MEYLQANHTINYLVLWPKKHHCFYISRNIRLLQRLLKPSDIDIAPKLAADLVQGADGGEAETLMKGDGAGIGQGDDRICAVEFGFFDALEQGFIQCGAGAPGVVFGVGVNGGLAGKTVGGSGAKATIVGEPGHFPVRLGDQHYVRGFMVGEFVEPGFAALRAPRFEVEGDGGVQDIVVVNPVNGDRIVGGRRSDRQ